MSDRDDLAEAIFSAMNKLPMERSDHIGIAREDMRDVADLLLASGWTHPSAVTTLRRQLEDARALVVRSGLFERLDCDCVFTRHESDLCGALTEEELADAGVDTDHSIGQEPLYDDGGPVCLPCRHGDHSAHQPTLADVCVGCACEVMR